VKVLVTGATGFVGRALLHRIIADGRISARAAVRGERDTLSASVECVQIGDLSSVANWQPALSGIDSVIHLAGRAHIMRERVSDPLAEFRRVNAAATEKLARDAATAGVRRLVYISSIKVNGESGTFTEADQAKPEDPYAISKHEAELALRRIASETALEVVIIRPPLVYGPGVRANFRALMRAIERGIPLPFGAVNNRRSVVAVDNLVDLILACIEHQAAANELFLISDGEDLSTTDLIRRIAKAMGRPARLIPVPVPLLLAVATALGKRDIARRLLGSLQVDISKARRRLNWTPPVSVDEGLRRAVATP
jgi:nucleoside-diphosphate-sugar epimerase